MCTYVCVWRAWRMHLRFLFYSFPSLAGSLKQRFNRRYSRLAHYRKMRGKKYCVGIRAIITAETLIVVADST